MAIRLGQGFNITSSEPIDKRLILTKTEMLNANDNLMPTHYFAICADDDKIYTYNKNRTPNSVTGKFEPIEASENSIIKGYYFNEKFYTDSTYTVECEKSTSAIYINLNNAGNIYTWDGTKYNAGIPQASATIAGIVKLYQNSGLNEDGAMSQKVVTEGVQSINLNVDQTDEECLILDLPWDNQHGKY